MKIKLKTKINQENFFYIGFTILLIKYAMASTNYAFTDFTGHLLVAIGIVCLVIKIRYTSYSDKELMGILVLGILALVVFVCGRDDEILAVAILVMAFKNTNIQTIIKIWTLVYSCVFVGTIVIALVTQENIYVYDIFRLDNQYEFRYCLGFLHPNALQGMFFKIICGLLLQYKTLKCYMLLFIGNAVLFIFTDSRAGALSAFLVILGVAVIRGIKRERFTFKVLCYIEMLCTMLVLIGTIVLTYLYTRYRWIYFLDQIITGRIRIARIFANQMSVSLFGTPLPKLNGFGQNVVDGGLAFDCGVIRTFLNYGIFLYILLFLACIIAIFLFWKEKHIIEPIIILGCLVYAICENAFFNPLQNIGMLLVMYFAVWHITIQEQSDIVKSKEEKYEDI